MKPRAAPPVPFCDENIVVDFHEMISLLIGRDRATLQAFRNDVLQCVAEIRNPSLKGSAVDGGDRKIIPFPMGYSCSA
jgi:hypothetical protein